MPSPEPIPRRKRYQELLDRVIERIRNGEIPPGAQLPSERELMAFYAVGRPAVREALQSLERSGIVEITHGERARVVIPTAGRLIEQIAGGARHLLRSQPDTLEHLKDARVFMEVGIARLATERATKADIARLRERLAERRASLIDLDDFVMHDMAFHREIAGIGGNPIFPELVEVLFGWASEHHQPIVRAPGAEELTLAEYARIIDAIASGKPQLAERAVREHLTRPHALYRQLNGLQATATAAAAAAT